MFDVDKFADYNKKDLFKKAKHARCYYCFKIVTTEDFLKWEKEGFVVWDQHDHCFCQHCSVDAILPEHEEYDIFDDDFMQEMHQYWFGYY